MDMKYRQASQIYIKFVYLCFFMKSQNLFTKRLFSISIIKTISMSLVALKSIPASSVMMLEAVPPMIV